MRPAVRPAFARRVFAERLEWLKEGLDAIGDACDQVWPTPPMPDVILLDPAIRADVQKALDEYVEMREVVLR